MQDAYAVKTWATLDDVLTTTLGGQKAQGGLEALYRAIEKICLVGRALETEPPLLPGHVIARAVAAWARWREQSVRPHTRERGAGDCR